MFSTIASCVILTIASFDGKVFCSPDNARTVILRRGPTGAVIARSLGHSNILSIHGAQTQKSYLADVDREENVSSKTIKSIIEERLKKNDAKSPESYIIINSPDANIIINMAHPGPNYHPENIIAHYKPLLPSTTTNAPPQDPTTSKGKYYTTDSYINHYLNFINYNFSTLADASNLADEESDGHAPDLHLGYNEENFRVNQDEELFEVRDKGFYINKSASVKTKIGNNNLEEKGNYQERDSLNKREIYELQKEILDVYPMLRRPYFGSNNHRQKIATRTNLTPTRVQSESLKEELNDPTETYINEVWSQGRNSEANESIISLHPPSISQLLSEVQNGSEIMEPIQITSTTPSSLQILSHIHHPYYPHINLTESLRMRIGYPVYNNASALDTIPSKPQSLTTGSYNLSQQILNNLFANRRGEIENNEPTIQAVVQSLKKISNDVLNHLQQSKTNSSTKELQAPFYGTNVNGNIRKQLALTDISYISNETSHGRNNTSLTAKEDFSHINTQFQIGSQLPFGANPRNVYPLTTMQTTNPNATRITQSTIEHQFPSTIRDEVATRTHDLIIPVSAQPYLYSDKKYIMNEERHPLLKSFLSPVLLLLGVVFAVSAAYTASRMEEQTTTNDLRKGQYIETLLDQPFFRKEKQLNKLT